MGSDNSSQQYPQYNNITQNTQNNYSYNNSNLNQNNNKITTDKEKLIPLRRHSNTFVNSIINNSYNNTQPSNPLHSSLNSSLNFKKSNTGEIPTPIFQTNKNRKLSQQYCASFKKSYLEGGYNQNTFLNHLADSLNHGKQLPIEEFERFKKDYLPKYILDWRNIENQNNGIRYWKNFGKIETEKAGEIIEKIGDNKISINEPFYLRRCWFGRYLMKNYARNKNENPIVYVRRENILEDSYNIFTKNKFNLARQLNIRFTNENIEDEGGIYKDWYQSMFKDIISPNKKLFLINPYKTMEPNNIIIYPKYPGMKLEYYEFIGKFIIKSLVDRIHIRNFIINKAHLKLITKKEISLDDMKYFNLDLYSKLKYINDNTIIGNKQLENIRFIWNINTSGNYTQEIELVPGGKGMLLNDQNKNIFINKVIYVETIMPYEEQIKYIQKGLFSILGEGVQGIFSVEEMNFMITGQEDIDLKDLRENIVYKGEYNENHPVIKMFWEKLITLNKNELIQFLKFSTGSSAVPIDGFGSLKNIYGRIQKLTIEPFMNFSAENPDVYTFHKIESKKQNNTIILPKYRTKRELDDAINMIIFNKV